VIRSCPMILAVPLAALSLGACDGAQDGPMVPFKRNPTTLPHTSGDTPDPLAESAEGEGHSEGESRRHEGGQSLSIDDKPVDVASARASFTLDLDGDELDDVLVWAGDAEVAPQLFLARGTAGGATFTPLAGSTGYGPADAGAAPPAPRPAPAAPPARPPPPVAPPPPRPPLPAGSAVE